MTRGYMVLAASLLWSATVAAQPYPHAKLSGHDKAVTALAWAGDSQRLATGGVDHKIIVWHAPSAKLLHSWQAHDGPLSALVFSPDSRQLASSSKRESSVRLWDVTSGSQLWSRHSIDSRSLSFSPDGTVLAGAGHMATLWQAKGGEQIKRLGKRPVKNAVAFAPDGERLAIGDDDQVEIWSASSGDLLHKYSEIYWPNAIAVEFSADGKWLAAISDRAVTVKLWATDGSGSKETFRREPPLKSSDVALSSDGQWLAAASIDSPIVALWNLRKTDRAYQLSAHLGGITQIAFSPNGRWLAAASLDKSVSLWDLNTLGLSTGYMVIVSGSKDPKTANQLLEDYWERGWPSHGDYPKLLDSSKVQGLNPGFWIVVAAVASDRDVAGELNAYLRQSGAESYVREVQVPSPENLHLVTVKSTNLDSELPVALSVWQFCKRAPVSSDSTEQYRTGSLRLGSTLPSSARRTVIPFVPVYNPIEKKCLRHNTWIDCEHAANDRVVVCDSDSGTFQGAERKLRTIDHVRCICKCGGD